ncbi:UNKNOWN [Stylonychia lemnae]|uniref:Uncharacterized protein n=1 Tax=Stylonychia lemnae TaxID=5949 RepID=A0A078A8A1_STYLE|nr:UNKNOWN [Stylonychia lemnae]|eukprot:CDW78485.1 UNKNOWN [Stylonychia lemnae]
MSYLEHQVLVETSQNISEVDYQLSPEKLAELEALIKTMEEVTKMMEQVHDEVEVDGVLYTATQTAAKFAFEAFDYGIQSIGFILTEARDLIDIIQIVIDKTGEQYFQISLIRDLKEPLINLGHWIGTMKHYTENIQQNYFAQSILVLNKIQKNYNKNQDLYTQVYKEWSKFELARTDDFQSDWADIEKAINRIADQFLSALNSQKINDMMASVARMFSSKCEQAVMASEVAAAHAAVNNAQRTLKKAIASKYELLIVRECIVKALTQMNAISHLHPTLLTTAQIMKFTTAKVTSLVKETKVQIERNSKYNPGFASEMLLEYYETNSKLLVRYVQAWDVLQSKAISGTPTIIIKLK